MVVVGVAVAGVMVVVVVVVSVVVVEELIVVVVVGWVCWPCCSCRVAGTGLVLVVVGEKVGAVGDRIGVVGDRVGVGVIGGSFVDGGVGEKAGAAGERIGARGCVARGCVAAGSQIASSPVPTHCPTLLVADAGVGVYVDAIACRDATGVMRFDLPDLLR